MKLIVGLGNPGSDYHNTRHNAGYMVLDELARRHAPGERAQGKFHAAVLEARMAGEKVLLAKPTTFMNRSGLTVGEAVRFFKLQPADDLLIVVDDIALPLGAIRLRARGGGGGHNGLADVERAVGGPHYARLRVGVDNKPAGSSQVGYVLGRFTVEQLEAIRPGIEKAADAAERWAAEGIDAAMNAFNAPPEPKQPRKAAGDANRHANRDPKNHESSPEDPTPRSASGAAGPGDQSHGDGGTQPGSRALAGHPQPEHPAKDS
ncbi:MAG: aminoacyl-tRNA hydrolase [Planctomycetota bacterium]